MNYSATWDSDFITVWEGTRELGKIDLEPDLGPSSVFVEFLPKGEETVVLSLNHWRSLALTRLDGTKIWDVFPPKGFDGFIKILLRTDKEIVLEGQIAYHDQGILIYRIEDLVSNPKYKPKWWKIPTYEGKLIYSPGTELVQDGKMLCLDSYYDVDWIYDHLDELHEKFYSYRRLEGFVPKVGPWS